MKIGLLAKTYCGFQSNYYYRWARTTSSSFTAASILSPYA